MIVHAQAAVDLELALAVDASGSVSAHRFHLQQQGYAAAFRHPDVLKAIRSGATQSIAVIMYQWTGPSLQIVSVPWHRIHDQTSAEAFAAAIAETPRQLFGGGTSISGAIDYGVTLFPNSGYRSARLVIDISGDGINNRGRAVTQARDEAVEAGITINGLPILALVPSLDQYFQDHVIGGPGAFVIPAADFETFGEAIRRRYQREGGRRRSGPRHDYLWVVVGLFERIVQLPHLPTSLRLLQSSCGAKPTTNSTSFAAT
jgi:hypothetical protein